MLDIKEIKISQFKKNNQKELVDFCKLIYKEKEWDWSYVEDLENISKYYGNFGDSFFIAKNKENKIVGIGGLKRLNKKQGLLRRLYIAKKYRGLGLSVLIFNKITEFAKKNKFDYIVLDVFNGNDRAQKFFEKMGFKKFKQKYNSEWSETNSPELFSFYRKKII